MKFNKTFLVICILLLLCSIAAVSANDLVNDTDSGDDESVKVTPVITVNTTSVYTGDSIDISFSDENKTPITNKNFTANIDNKDYNLFTDSQGKSSLKLDLKASKYVLYVEFLGDENYTSLNQTFKINVLKLNSNLNPLSTTVLKGDYLYVYLKDQKNEAITGVIVSLTVNGKTYERTTNKDGRVALKINLNPYNHSIKMKFSGNEYYNAVSKTINLLVPATTTLVVGNTMLLTNGYLRIYLKSDTASAVSKKTVIITVGNKTFNKTTNSEGIIVIKPGVGVGTFNVTVIFGGDSTVIGCIASKNVNGVSGSPKNPLKTKIPLKNGVPDVDYMTSNFVMADDDMTYTLLKAQYMEVIKRDSYCLYLNNKLSKYTFFKTKGEPNLYHIIKREKWNVIERAINTKIVQKNKNNYWPSSIKVSLKGKSYNYPEVRDVQNTGYTCGPTSCSMCSQVLRNYICESQLAKQAGSSPYSGSSTKGLKKALEKNNFKCSIYYKSTFDKALKHLKKGGCALVFHTWSHYVAILDISKDGKKVLVGNPSGDYDHGSHSIPTNWLTVIYMKKMFNNYDTSGLIVKLKYSLSKATKTKINNFYSSMGTNWVRQNTNERIPQI
ncbi:cysteine peptidase family C39 domain-containing protein [Methanobrevibacter sp.]|uniref:cysteine peptidase family C39 domain-containing protein n=1 Tax=Methanobrevibacter sp. TaxID=66852 RepID=UPI00388ED701